MALTLIKTFVQRTLTAGNAESDPESITPEPEVANAFELDRPYSSGEIEALNANQIRVFFDWLALIRRRITELETAGSTAEVKILAHIHAQLLQVWGEMNKQQPDMLRIDSILGSGNLLPQ